MQTDKNWTVVRLIQRLLEEGGPETRLGLNDQQVRVIELLNGLPFGTTFGFAQWTVDAALVNVEEGAGTCGSAFG